MVAANNIMLISSHLLLSRVDSVLIWGGSYHLVAGPTCNYSLSQMTRCFRCAGYTKFYNKYYNEKYMLLDKSIRFAHEGDIVACSFPGWASAGYVSSFGRDLGSGPFEVDATYEPFMRQCGQPLVTDQPCNCNPFPSILRFPLHMTRQYWPVLAEIALRKCYAAKPPATSFGDAAECADFSGITSDVLAYADGRKAFIVGTVKRNPTPTRGGPQTPLAGWHVNCMDDNKPLDPSFVSASTTWIDGSFLSGFERLFAENPDVYCRLGGEGIKTGITHDWQAPAEGIQGMLNVGQLALATKIENVLAIVPTSGSCSVTCDNRAVTATGSRWRAINGGIAGQGMCLTEGNTPTAGLGLQLVAGTMVGGSCSVTESSDGQVYKVAGNPDDFCLCTTCDGPDCGTFFWEHSVGDMGPDACPGAPNVPVPSTWSLYWGAWCRTRAEHFTGYLKGGTCYANGISTTSYDRWCPPLELHAPPPPPLQASGDGKEGSAHECMLLLLNGPLCVVGKTHANAPTPTKHIAKLILHPPVLHGCQTGVTGVTAGYGHTCAAKTDGSVVCWGSNYYGQTTVPTAGLTNVTGVAAGYGHTCAAKTDGSVVCWGSNDYGQTTVPAGLTGVTGVSVGLEHMCAAKTDGSVVCWGSNLYGQTTVPTGLTGVTGVAARLEHMCAAKTDGSVVCWGYNYYGQTTVPAGLTGVTGVATGGYHTCAAKTDGRWCVGDGMYMARRVSRRCF
jgi:hypothetical protein